MDVKNCFVGDVATFNCLPSLFSTVTYGFLLFSGVVALFIIAWASLRMITSGGDAKQVESFRKMITYAIIGLVVVLSAFSIVNFIGYLTKTSSCISDINSILKGCK